ncbi:hypothetical protein PG999_001507 [Apiospora kogelbergensis]|uniref:Uncharacterized protein n=1 Tax=Apiospora kogelbergensis TaxID=1337665 RepID=A0AAW0R5H6_9PEZI
MGDLTFVVAGLENKGEKERWNALVSLAVKEGVSLAAEHCDKTKTRLGDRVCGELFKQNMVPFVSREHYWYLVHKAAAELWLPAKAADIVKSWKIDVEGNRFCGTMGERPCSEQYVRFWMQKNQLRTSRKQQQEKFLNDTNAKSQEKTSRYQQHHSAANRSDILVGSRMGVHGDVTPRWSNQADVTAIMLAMQKMEPNAKPAGWKLEYMVPQQIWTMALGETWEEIGHTLRSTAAEIGPVFNNKGEATPMFQPQLELAYKEGDGERKGEWMARVCLRWDTTAFVLSDHFQWIALVHAVNFFRCYMNTIITAWMDKKEFPRMNRCAPWAFEEYQFKLMPQKFELDAAAAIEQRWAEAHPTYDPVMDALTNVVGGLQVRPAESHDLAQVLLEYLDDEMPGDFKAHIAGMALSMRLLTLHHWVQSGDWGTYPVAGSGNMANRKRWARLAVRYMAKSIFQGRFEVFWQEIKGEYGQTRKEMAETLVSGLSEFVQGTAAGWLEFSIAEERLQQAREILDGWVLAVEKAGFHDILQVVRNGRISVDTA